MDSVRSGPFGQIFKPDNFVFGKVFNLFITFINCPFNFVSKCDVCILSPCQLYMAIVVSSFSHLTCVVTTRY